ncbi:Uncharacterised protein [Pseudomonas aeruginosa]|nr:Uncharacterised protein [Klebsiella pneumoniae]VTM08935.1 Uncharacterised protein [Pseudomonas aeruginosa]
MIQVSWFSARPSRMDSPATSSRASQKAARIRQKSERMVFLLNRMSGRPRG